MVNKTTLGGAGPTFIPPSAPLGGPVAVDAPKPPTSAAPLDGPAGPGTLFPASTAPAVVPAKLTGSIATQFPFDDLGSIETKGRWATGFSLDGGSVRLMWISARRVNDEGNKRGFELSFFLQGSSIAKLKERLEKKGATAGTLPFYGAELAPDAQPGKDTLIRNATTWSPGGQGLVLHVEDKYTVHLVDAQPEALKGAVRIRVYGDDAQSTAGLTEAINKLGLQHAFAPPTPESLERLKLTRFLWATQPELLEKATWASPAEISAAAVTAAYDAVDLPADHASRQAIAAVDLADAKNAKRASLAQLLWDTSPKAFFDWAKSDSYSQHGILPSSSSDYGINNALKAAGIEQDSPEYLAAAAATPAAAAAKKLFELGFVIKQAPARAEGLLHKSLEDVKPAQLEDLVHAAGIDVTGDRLEKLEFREVYPGYFTPYDPQLPQRLHDVGARYLYSTLDNPERVFEVLTGGQKASLTRFQEGRLVQGKSSSSDFGTGGAFSIFTRLVTESAVQSGKKQKKSGASSGYYNSAGFNNWGGSRPFKVILNKSVLGRLDWYGYNGDNYGRSTGLKAANHAEKIVETIEKAYSSSNELMFPVGSAPSHIDFVVCEKQEQKDALLKLLGEKGITHFNGKPVDQLVRIETSFFEHPDDLTVEAAIKDALETLELKSAQDASKAVAGPYAQAHAAAETEKAAHTVAAEALPTVLQSLASQGGNYVAQQQVTAALKDALQALPPAVEQAAIEAAQAAAASTVAEAPAHLATNVSWTVQNQLKSLVQPKLVEAFAVVGPAIAAAAAEKAKATLLGGGDVNGIKAAVRTALNAEGKKAALDHIQGGLTEPALTIVREALKSTTLSTARNTLSTPINEAAVTAGRAKAEETGTMEALRLQVMAAGTEPVATGVGTAVKNGLVSALRSQVQSKTKPAAEASLVAGLGSGPKEAARAAAEAEITERVKAIAAEFSAAHPDKPVSVEGEALAALVDVGLARADAVALWHAGAVVGQSIDPLLQAAVDGAVGAVAGADHGAALAAQVEKLLATQTESQLTSQLRTWLTQKTATVLEDAAQARAAAWVDALAPAAAEAQLAQAANGTPSYLLESVINALVQAEADKLS